MCECFPVGFDELLRWQLVKINVTRSGGKMEKCICLNNLLINNSNCQYRTRGCESVTAIVYERIIPLKQKIDSEIV